MPCSTTQLTSVAARNALAFSERMTGRPHRASAPGSRPSNIAMSSLAGTSLFNPAFSSRGPSAAGPLFLERAELGDGVSVTEVAASWTKAVKQTGLASA